MIPMKNTLSLAITAVAVALSAPAYAGYTTVSFTGVVYQTLGTTPSAVGDTISGQFTLTGDPGAVVNFTIDGQSPLPGSESAATIIPSEGEAIYSSQYLSTVQGGTINDSLEFALSALSGTFPSSDDPATLLTDSGQIPGNLDWQSNDPGDPLFASTFDYVVENSNGTFTGTEGAEFAELSSINVTVPEPASFALLATSLFGFVAARRRR
jgi:hypothetical protein